MHLLVLRVVIFAQCYVFEFGISSVLCILLDCVFKHFMVKLMVAACLTG